MKRCFKPILVIVLFAIQLPIYSIQFNVIGKDGSKIELEIDPNESFQSFLTKVEQCSYDMDNEDIVIEGSSMDSQTQIAFELVAKKSGYKHCMGSQPLNKLRNFDAPVNVKEKKDVRFILKTLAECSLPSLWTKKKELEKVGARIDHLHPLNFFSTVFCDEELKVYLLNIRNRSWVWGEFFDGYSHSFEDERKIGNLKPEQIDQFCKTVGIDKNLVTRALYEGRWQDFVDILIIHLPRKGQSDRYDM
jgi:hypothetical protein